MQRQSRRIDSKYLPLLLVAAAVFWNEWFAYRLAVSWCAWPSIDNEDAVRLLISGDTHLIGPRGAWIDRVRREWSMSQLWTSAHGRLKPQISMILGDVYDEGKWVHQLAWQNYLQRSDAIFVDEGIRGNTLTEKDKNELIIVVGNHDVGFHGPMNRQLVDRFTKAHHPDGIEAKIAREDMVRLEMHRDINFIIINSMAFEGDNCELCTQAKGQLRDIAAHVQKRGLPDRMLRTTVLLSHFPLYRERDNDCIDYQPNAHPNAGLNRAGKDVISKRASRFILQELDPDVVFSAHQHYQCSYMHYPQNGKTIPEYTVSTFNWRNRPDPSFDLATLSPSHSDAADIDEIVQLTTCHGPDERNVFLIYSCVGILVVALYVVQRFAPRTLNIGQRSPIMKKRAM
eukprot:Clim_evm23s236 gene=Clim_evmTU23s236